MRRGIYEHLRLGLPDLGNVDCGIPDTDRRAGFNVDRRFQHRGPRLSVR